MILKKGKYHDFFRRLNFTMIGPGIVNVICLIVLAYLVKKKDNLPSQMPSNVAALNNQRKNTNLFNFTGIMASLFVYIASFFTPVLLANFQIFQSSSQYVFVSLVFSSWCASILFPIMFFACKKNALKTVIAEAVPNISTIS